MKSDYKYITADNKVSLGYRKWIKGSQSRHLHDGYEILYVVSGKRDMFIEDKVLHMTSGDIVLIPPNTLHKSFNNYDGSEIYSLYLNSISGISIEKLFLLRSTQISDIILKIDKEFKNNEIAANQLINALGLKLFIYILRKSFQNEVLDIKVVNCNKTIQQIVKYINQKYQEELNLKFLSKEFNLSQGHLSRSFKKHTGFSLIDYINHIRIQKSNELLLKSNHTISYICYFCGFGSLTNFGRLFKKLNGKSPREYRKLK
ncbi:MAG: AraC family transcriptional regulator [Spirochaetaceae bacterium]